MELPDLAPHVTGRETRSRDGRFSGSRRQRRGYWFGGYAQLYLAAGALAVLGATTLAVWVGIAGLALHALSNTEAKTRRKLRQQRANTRRAFGR